MNDPAAKLSKLQKAMLVAIAAEEEKPRYEWQPKRVAQYREAIGAYQPPNGWKSSRSEAACRSRALKRLRDRGLVERFETTRTVSCPNYVGGTYTKTHVEEWFRLTPLGTDIVKRLTVVSPA